MKIGYAYCSNDAFSENRAALTEVGCKCVLHDSLGQGRKALLNIRQLLHEGDTLLIRSARQAADTLHELDGLVRDVTAAKAEVMIAEGHTTQTLRQVLTLLRCFDTAVLPPDGFGDQDPAPHATAGRSVVRRGGRKPGRPIDEEDVVSRLAAGESVNGIAKHLGVDWATINRIKRARSV